MSALRDSAAALHEMKAVSGRDAGAVLRSFQRGNARDAGNTLRTVFNALSASASPDYVDGAGYSASGIRVTTSLTTVTVTGGTAPYTHAWTTMDAGWDAVSPTFANTAFRSPSLTPGMSASATFTDTVTDANGQTTTVDVSAYAANNF